MNRREFLKNLGFTAASLSLFNNYVKAVDILPLQPGFFSRPTIGKVNGSTHLSFGMVTDSHYADINVSGNRYYRDSIDKMAEAIALFNSQQLDFLMETGDYKDKGADAAQTISFLQAIETAFQQFNGPTYHVLGNHDTDNISKTQFLANIVNTNIDPAGKYYSFDFNSVHCVVLDANYRSDGVDYDSGNFDWTDANIPPAELTWLQQDLAATSFPTLVFIHQLLDGVGTVYVKNAPAVRTVLENSNKVMAVFQGHYHEGRISQINGIHYYTLIAMVVGSYPPSNSYATVEVQSDQIIITGYVNAVSQQLPI